MQHNYLMESELLQCLQSKRAEEEGGKGGFLYIGVRSPKAYDIAEELSTYLMGEPEQGQ